MAETAFCEIESSVDGPITGESSARDRDDLVEVLKFDFTGYVPSDPSDPARAAGIRLYDAVMIETKMDKSMPLIMKQLAENSVLPKIEVKFYRQPDSGGGDPVNFLIHTFTDCRLYHVDPKVTIPHLGTDSQQRFSFKFFFNQHSVDYPADGLSFTDDVRHLV